MQVGRQESRREKVCQEVACEHCGTRFQPVQAEEKFCCSGCEYVYRIIHDESLERFYELRGEVSRPVGSSVFENNDYPWLAALVEVAESKGKLAQLSLALEGISCVGCVWLIDRVFAEAKGGVSCRVNVQYGTLDLEWESGVFDVLGFAGRIKQFGYRVCPARETSESESRKVVWKLGLSGAFALNGMLYTLPGYLGMEADFLVASHFNWLSAFFASLSLVFCGSYFIAKAAKAAAQGIAHLDLPISIGIVFAYLVSWYGIWKGDDHLVYFDFVSTFVFLMLVGRWLQVVAIERNRNRLADIQLSAPEVEIESSTGGRIKTRADQIKEGEVYWLASGQRVPVRSALLSERASLGMDWISGESESRIVEIGGEAPSGAELENQFSVRLEAQEDWGDSLLSKLSSRGTRAQERDLVAQKWIFRYLVVAFAIAVMGGASWLAVDGLSAGLKVFISVLVVSCPCALGIAWPFGDEIALARLKQQGVFVTTHSLWNRLTRIRRIVFDKTGTLTRSSLALVNPECLERLSTEELSALSALCSKSRHPVSSTIRECLMAKGRYRPQGADGLQEIVGKGVALQGRESVWRLGKLGWAGTEGSGTLFSRNGRVLVDLRFEDLPLPDSSREVAGLREAGFEVVILSGDREEKAQGVGQALGLEAGAVFGNLLPEEKARWIEAREPERTLMVGDGANDTLAFRSALCCGAPANEQGIVAEKADFHYLGNGIGGIRRLLAIGKQRRRAVQWLMAFALAYNLFAVGLSLVGWVTPLIAAVLMPASSVVSLAIVWAVLGSRAAK
ncbi:heavy metal translocating P-type ATPase metal-binding domain-containing protein [Pelagicoccus sp. NFK12]|uniref:Heavy metal translocating P-type ATPase metal-binding domain-containing protein n=1 Tax=Pelagicoccus enzymogenes TaxID=2773457 RepID=A0A927IHK8_9BACT|nr:heavy metal translocating P-type ATPase metal-binding domain-containing protein [Pelagicoccus enzymogenes]MBD5782397.1 heavy metal translocating P-type ATPase metal-binding domain-containing protein [Pelagicoccus enzymogenes]